MSTLDLPDRDTFANLPPPQDLKPAMRIAVTGAAGFIGRNLCSMLGGRDGFAALAITRDTTAAEIEAMLTEADAVIHLAGANRPADQAEFARVNDRFAAEICARLAAAGRPIPLVLASSVQAGQDTPYGRSKRAAERHAEAYAKATGAPVAIYRLANVMGKWCRPDYNSVVATFCHNLNRGLPIRIDDPDARLDLVHVDDVADAWLAWLSAPSPGIAWPEAGPVHATTVGDLACLLTAIRDSPETLVLPDLASGLARALYSVYASYAEPGRFAHPLVSRTDGRGTFVEFLKSEGAGQVSCFTAHPGVTRGGHFHHSKCERFLVVSGEARFRFRHVETGETSTLTVSSASPRMIEAPPGWAHDITNTGTETLVVMLWAHEIFDPARPDTHASELGPCGD